MIGPKPRSVVKLLKKAQTPTANDVPTSMGLTSEFGFSVVSPSRAAFPTDASLLKQKPPTLGSQAQTALVMKALPFLEDDVNAGFAAPDGSPPTLREVPSLHGHIRMQSFPSEDAFIRLAGRIRL